MRLETPHPVDVSPGDWSIEGTQFQRWTLGLGEVFPERWSMAEFPSKQNENNILFGTLQENCFFFVEDVLFFHLVLKMFVAGHSIGKM